MKALAMCACAVVTSAVVASYISNMKRDAIVVHCDGNCEECDFAESDDCSVDVVNAVIEDAPCCNGEKADEL